MASPEISFPSLNAEFADTPPASQAWRISAPSARRPRLQRSRFAKKNAEFADTPLTSQTGRISVPSMFLRLR